MPSKSAKIAKMAKRIALRSGGADSPPADGATYSPQQNKSVSQQGESAPPERSAQGFSIESAEQDAAHLTKSLKSLPLYGETFDAKQYAGCTPIIAATGAAALIEKRTLFAFIGTADDKLRASLERIVDIINRNTVGYNLPGVTILPLKTVEEVKALGNFILTKSKESAIALVNSSVFPITVVAFVRLLPYFNELIEVILQGDNVYLILVLYRVAVTKHLSSDSALVDRILTNVLYRPQLLFAFTNFGPLVKPIDFVKFVLNNPALSVKEIWPQLVRFVDEDLECKNFPDCRNRLEQVARSQLLTNFVIQLRGKKELTNPLTFVKAAIDGDMILTAITIQLYDGDTIDDLLGNFIPPKLQPNKIPDIRLKVKLPDTFTEAFNYSESQRLAGKYLRTKIFWMIADYVNDMRPLRTAPCAQAAQTRLAALEAVNEQADIVAEVAQRAKVAQARLMSRLITYHAK